MNYNEILNGQITLEVLFESMPVALALVDRDGKYVIANKALASLGGVFSDGLKGKKVRTISITAEMNILQDFKRYDAGLRVPDHELKINESVFKVSVSPIFDNNGKAIAEMVAITDITQIKEIETKLSKANKKLFLLSTQDSLTKLLNVRAYYEKVDNLIEKTGNKQTKYSVLFIDIDNFKQINDTYGHGVGDVVLSSTANVLKNFCREEDIIGRVGGDEFSVFLPRTSYSEAMIIAENLRLAIEIQEIETEIESLKITASIGVASGTLNNISSSEVHNKADSAMYIAKRKHGNKVSGIE